MALPWWLTTTACAQPPAGSLADLLAFVFLSPCPQRALLGAVDLAFPAACLALAARRRLLRSGGGSGAGAPESEAILDKPGSPSRLLSFRRCYVAALDASAVVAAASVVLLVLALQRSPRPSSWRAAESAFLAAPTVARLLVA